MSMPSYELTSQIQWFFEPAPQNAITSRSYRAIAGLFSCRSFCSLACWVSLTASPVCTFFL